MKKQLAHILRNARAQSSARLDRAWSSMESRISEIERIKNAGPAAEDIDLMRHLAALVWAELLWRQAERSRMEQGGLGNE